MVNNKIREPIGDRVFNVINFILVTAFFLIVAYPLYFVIIASISDIDAVSTGRVLLYPIGFTLEGYRRAFADNTIMAGYRNTIFYTVVGTLFNLFLTLPAAYALSKKELPLRNLLMGIFVFTMYFGGGMIPTYLLVKNLKLLDTWWVLVVTSGVSCYNLIIARTFFATGVPQELEEAAKIDGCSRVRLFVSIVMPLSKAMIAVLALYYGIGRWNSWFGGMIYLNSRAKAPLQLILRDILIENQQMAMDETGIGAEAEDLRLKLATLLKYCLILISSAPVLIIYPFLQKYFNQGVMLGSVKG
ncbi:MAG: carbohydrate ABC transporter permease [Clostridiaceae bacterium]|nr:carbohydrate ABC transporter permease [Clostridiales bacterium]MDD6877600.1 carbohydrate ABC transporter permease [Clostridiaceae bacterium]MDY3287349.1 carbohydrate ABC transporter permease [Eubacteriales bacterium]MDY5016775.1 carbohydrate ABC transporter permease [Eubacteriales bacterium]